MLVGACGCGRGVWSMLSGFPKSVFIFCLFCLVEGGGKHTGGGALSEELNHGSTADGAGTEKTGCVHFCGLVGDERSVVNVGFLGV